MSIENPGFETLAPALADPEKARELIEAIRWPDGPVCPHCDSDEAYALTPKPGSRKPVRRGVYKCKACRKQFTVTVKTIFEGTRIPLNKWLYILQLMTNGKKGVSAHQIHRTVGISYKAAWFACHRIRKAMEKEPLSGKLSGIVEVDETYVGGKKRGIGSSGPSARGTKSIVFALVERDGEARSEMIEHFDRATAEEIMLEDIDRGARIMTDGAKSYLWAGNEFASHEVADHANGIYSMGDVSTNTVESMFSLLKRGIMGSFHHVSKKHLPRYLEEFDFRWNRRKSPDGARLVSLVRAVGGKRLYYKKPKHADEIAPGPEPVRQPARGQLLLAF